MTTFGVFQLEKNNADIIRTVLTNIVKMFTERGMLNANKLDEHIKKVTSIQSDDHIYIIDIDNPKDNSDKKHIIKIFNHKITGVSKQSNISEFLNKYKDMHKLVVVKAITPKLSQGIKTNYPKTEVFVENRLMINLVENVLVPRYEKLEYETEDFINFCEQYQCKKKNIPRLFQTEPMAEYYNLKKNDIVRVIRPSETSGESAFYRFVI